MIEARFIAQRAITGEFLDFELPLQVDELSWTLSGAGSLKGTVTPDTGRLRADDGELLLSEWNTLIYAEVDGEIRWGGIVISSSFNDESYTVECASFATYPHGMPFTGEFSHPNVDPTDVIRYLWNHMQGPARGKLGVVVGPSNSTARLGVTAVPAYDEILVNGIWLDGRQAALPDSATNTLAVKLGQTSKELTLVDATPFASLSLPFDIKIGTESIKVFGRSGKKLTGLERGATDSKAAVHEVGATVKHISVPYRRVTEVKPEPYTLSTSDNKDMGQEIDQLCKDASIDFIERHAWNGENISHNIDLYYPRAGRRREDLSFVQGVNIVEVVAPVIEGDDYANEVIGIGAGEGAKSLRSGIAIDDGRLRRVKVFVDKGISLKSRLDQRVKEELTKAQKTMEITSITVMNHPDAQFGSWSLGDDILVQADIPWLGEVDLWCRVMAWSLKSDGTATLSLTRSDTFRYGA